jgi:hypothetical protein
MEPYRAAAPVSAPSGWYIMHLLDENRISGPFTVEELRSQLAAKQLWPHYPVSRTEQGGFEFLENIPELRQALNISAPAQERDPLANFGSPSNTVATTWRIGWIALPIVLILVSIFTEETLFAVAALVIFGVRRLVRTARRFG